MNNRSWLILTGMSEVVSDHESCDLKGGPGLFTSKQCTVVEISHFGSLFFFFCEKTPYSRELVKILSKHTFVFVIGSLMSTSSQK